jgi:hypothetical protein
MGARDVQILVYHDEVVVECDTKRGVDAKGRLEWAMLEGTRAVVNGTEELYAMVEVEARIARRLGGRG